MSEYLQELAQKLELNYLGVVGSDGIIIYQTPYEKEGLPEEVAGAVGGDSILGTANRSEMWNKQRRQTMAVRPRFD